MSFGFIFLNPDRRRLTVDYRDSSLENTVFSFQ